MSAPTQNKRVWLAGGAAAGVLIVLIGWFGVIHPQLSAAATTRDQVDSARLQNVVLQVNNDKLKEQNDHAAALRASLAAALAELPYDGGLPAFTRQLSAQATAASVVLTSVIVGAATPAAAAAAGATAESTAASASPTTAAGTTAVATTSAPSTGLVQITVTVSATGLGRDEMAFLTAIQVTGPRRALVSESTLAPTGSGAATGIDGQCTLNLTMTIFSAPMTPAAQAALEKLLSGK